MPLVLKQMLKHYTSYAVTLTKPELLSKCVTIFENLLDYSRNHHRQTNKYVPESH